MDNVIAFPEPATAQPKPAKARGSMTLFLHVKCATMIVHLANCDTSAAQRKHVVES